MIQLILEFWQKCVERMIVVYLTKNLLTLTIQQKNLAIVHEIFDLLPDFSRQLVFLFSNFVSIITAILLEIFSLFFLVITRNLVGLTNLILGFNFLTLMLLTLFRFYFGSSIKKNEREKQDCQQTEKTQLRNFLANASRSGFPSNLENIFSLLEGNSTRLFLGFFNLVLFRLSNLLIPGLSIIFLFFYYNFYQKKSAIDWNIYLIALGCQNIFLKIGRTFDLLHSWNSCHTNYVRLKIFFNSPPHKWESEISEVVRNLGKL